MGKFLTGLTCSEDANLNLQFRSAVQLTNCGKLIFKARLESSNRLHHLEAKIA